MMGLKGLLRAGLAVFLFCGTLYSAPFAERIDFQQPDGSTASMWGEGDEFYAVFETLDGYTVVFDQSLQAYCYATLSPDRSELLTTGVLVRKGSAPPRGTPQHLRITPEARADMVRERYARWDAGMEITRRWRERKAALRRATEEAAAAGENVVMAPPGFTMTGNKAGLCLLVDFSDDPATIPQASIVDFCNGDSYTGYGNNGSVKKYFQDNSGNLLTYSNVVTVYIRVPQPKTYYNDTSINCGTQGNILIQDAITAMKALPNYTTEILPAFANLTVDGSSRVIACNVFYAGGNGGVWSYGLWPHSWSLYNVGAQALGDGKSVFRYQITNIGTSLSIGTFCHENGHMLCGYPDIYDYGYDSVGGAGRFCLMNSGGHGGSPVQVCAYLKRASGWATTVELDSTSLLTASVSSSGPDFNRFYRYQKPGEPTEYYLIENRQQAGRDSSIPASGVAIWHIDEQGNRDNQSMVPNTTHQNYEVTLVQADNLWHFQNNVNNGDANDLYYSGNTAAAYSNKLSDVTTPHAHWWDGTGSGINFGNFSAKGTTMTFTVDPARAVSVTPLTDAAFAGPDGGPFTPASAVYTLTNARGIPVTWSVTHTESWATATPSGGTLPAGGSVVVTVSINAAADSLAAGTYIDTLVFANGEDADDETRTVTLRVGQPDYFTELFDTTANDTANQTFTFIPNGSASQYTATRATASSFPTDPTGGTTLTVSDDGSVLVALSGAQVSLYGVSYSSFYVGGNGYVTFGTSDGTYQESTVNHFSRPRIAALFDDLNPAAGGSISWRQLADRVAVTYLDVPEYGTYNGNNLQIEMFFTGAIRITCLGLSASDGLIGLSAGAGEPVDFLESDFTAYPDTPPQKTLVVASPHGVAIPAVGSHMYDAGMGVDCRVSAVEDAGTTRYVCTGWTGTGSVLSTGTDTQTVFTITDTSSITWQWDTEYLFASTAGAGGTVTSSGDGWYAPGASVSVTAAPSSGFTFGGWTGGVPAAQTNDNPLALTMDQARSVTANFNALSELIVDNSDGLPWVTVEGSWSTSSSASGYWGPDWLHDGGSGKGTKSVAYRPDLPVAGQYEVSVRYIAYLNRATNTPVEIVHEGITNTVAVNQRENGSQWFPVGVYSFAAGTDGTVRISNAGTVGTVIADAVRFERVTTGPALRLSAATLAPSCDAGQDAAAQSLDVWNGSVGTLSYTVSDDASWLSVAPASGTSAGETDTLTVTYSTAGLAAGTYNASITVSAAGAADAPQQVAVTLTVADAAVERIVDNSDGLPWVTVEGSWSTSSSASGYWGPDWLHDGGSGKGTKSVAYRPDLPVAGQYEVSVRYIAYLNRATNTPVEIVHEGITNTVAVNQRENGSQWFPVGVYSFAAGTDGTVRISNAGTVGTVIADAVRFERVTTGPALRLSAATLSPSCDAGQDAAAQSLDVWNGSVGTLSYTVSDDASWLSVAPASGTSAGETDTLTVTYSTAGLAAGTYDASITVSAAGAADAPQQVAVTLTVADAAVERIVDNSDGLPWVTVEGSWSVSSSASGYWGADWWHDGGTGKGGKSVTYQPELPEAGQYEVSVRYIAYLNRATNTPVEIVHEGITNTVAVNQRENGSQWFPIGVYSFAAGTDGTVRISNAGTDGTVVADAVRFERVTTGPALRLSAAALAPSCDAGQDAAAQSLDVWNGSVGTLSYTVSDDASWLSVAPASGTSAGETDTLTVTYSTAGLAAGTYNASITASAAGAADAPQQVAVTLTVADAAVERIVDNSDGLPWVTVEGSWSVSSSASGYWGADWWHDGGADKGGKSVTYQPDLPEAGDYEVSIRYIAYLNRAVNVPVEVVHGGGADTVAVNQRENGSQWFPVGVYSFAAGTSGSVRIGNEGTVGTVVADAVRFVRVGAPAPEGVTEQPPVVEESWPQVWASGAFSDEYEAANLLDGDTNTFWIGNTDATTWHIGMDLGAVTPLTNLGLQFLEEPWSNVSIVGRGEGLRWFDFMQMTNDVVPCRYLYIYLWSDGDQADPPALRELFPETE